MAAYEPIVRYYTCLHEIVASTRFIPPTAANIDTASVETDGRALIKLTRPSIQAFSARQLDLVNEWSSLREDRANEIVAQIPPPLAFWSSAMNLQQTRHAHTLEILNLALAFAAITAFRFKQAFGCPRPASYSSDIQPMIPTPEHSSLPSGHATEAFMVANVLAMLAGNSRKEARTLLPLLAGRIAVNRTIAGVHFPIDSHAGMHLGNAMAGHFLAHAGALGAQTELSPVLSPADDFLPKEHAAILDFAQITPISSGPAANCVQWLFNAAREEWQ